MELSPNQRDGLDWLRYLLAVILPVIALIWSALRYPPIVFWVTALLMPLPFGFWLGRSVRSAQLRSHAVSGMNIGLIGYLVISIVKPNFFLSPPALSVILPLLLVTTLMFVLGGLAGDWLRGRTLPRAGYKETEQRILMRLEHFLLELMVKVGAELVHIFIGGFIVSLVLTWWGYLQQFTRLL